MRQALGRRDLSNIQRILLEKVLERAVEGPLSAAGTTDPRNCFLLFYLHSSRMT